MAFLSDALGFLRFAGGLKPFLREPISVESAKAIIRHAMHRRDLAFLQKIEQAVFDNPRSPYLKLFRAAGCELGDVRTLVKMEGVEGTLHKLYQAGICVSFQEFKGRTPAVRGSQTFAFRDTDFDNPLITTHYCSSSGGIRGRPTRIRIDLDHIAQSAPAWALWFAAHDWLDNPLVFWTSTYSGTASSLLRFAKFGKRAVKWFATVGMGTVKGRLITACVHHLVQRAGGFPRPEFVPLSEARKVGEYLVRMVQDEGKPCINTSVSAAVRISLAMQERGTSLQNVSFLLRGEPLTRARKETIEASGAKAIQTYGFSEGGPVGSQCPHPTAADDVHIFLEAFAVIPHARFLGNGAKVDALLFTALRPASPKVLLNTEIGDYAVLETRRCGCLFDQLGYFQRLHNIRSFEKLTGEGVTFVGADIFHLLEDVLPKRFGGTVADYQLIEEQDATGIPRYTLRVDPSVGMLDEKELMAAFLKELGKMKSPYRLMADLWAQADVLHIQRQPPLVTTRGKVLPFYTLGPQ